MPRRGGWRWMPARGVRVPRREGERREGEKKTKKKARREKGGKAARAREEERSLDGGCYSDGKAAALAGSVPSPRILYERWRQLAAAPQTGRGAQGRRPGQPIPPPHTAPNRTPGPKPSRPGVGGARRRPPSPPPFPRPQHPLPAAPWGLSPPGRCTPLRGGDGKIRRGGSPWGVRGCGVGRAGAGERARTESGKVSAAEPAPSGAARLRSGCSQRRRRDARGWEGMEIGTAETNTLKSPKSGATARSQERDKPQRVFPSR